MTERNVVFVFSSWTRQRPLGKKKLRFFFFFWSTFFIRYHVLEFLWSFSFAMVSFEWLVIIGLIGAKHLLAFTKTLVINIVIMFMHFFFLNIMRVNIISGECQNPSDGWGIQRKRFVKWFRNCMLICLWWALMLLALLKGTQLWDIVYVNWLIVSLCFSYKWLTT